MRCIIVLIACAMFLALTSHCGATVVFDPVPTLPDGLEELQTEFVEVDVLSSSELGPMPRPYSDISQGAETGDANYYIQMSEMLGKMGGRLVRCEPFSDTRAITVTEDGKVEIDFTVADAIVDSLQRAGAKPVWNVADFPDAMLDDNGRPIADLLDQYVYQVTHRWNVEQERGIEYFEYWNEPPALDGPRFAVVVEAAHRADPTVKVGGPAIMGCSIPVLEEAVRYCVENDVDLGFISFHLYYEMPEGFLRHIENVEEMLAKYPGMEDLEMLITEWGVDAGLNGSCDTLYNAAYYTAIMDAVMHKWPRVRPMHFEFRDGWDHHGPSRDLWGRWGMVTYPHLLPKAVYNAGVMWHKLAETRIEAATSDPSVRVIAAKNDHEVTILIWSWPHEYRNLMAEAPKYTRSPIDIPVKIRLDEIPFDSAGVRYTRYVIDQTHSNVHFDIHTADLQQVQNVIFARAGREVHEEHRHITEGAFESTLVLPLHSLNLIVLRPEERPPVNVVATADRFNIWAGERAQVTIEPRFDEHLDLELILDPANRSTWQIEMISENPLSFYVEPPVADVKSMRYFNAWVRNRTSGAIGQTALEFQTDTPAIVTRGPEHIDVSPVTLEQQISVDIINKTPDVRGVDLVWNTPAGLSIEPESQQIQLQPSETTTVTVSARLDEGMRPDRHMAVAELRSGSHVISSLDVPVTLSLQSPRARGEVVIDGDLSDWEGVPSVTAASIRDFDGFLRRSWGGEEDISGTVWTQWDDEYLYFAFRVRDDEHVQELTTWHMKNYDAVHIGFDLERDSTDPNLFFDQGDCDYVFGYVNGEAHVYRHWGAQRSMGVPEGVIVAAKQEGDVITYEVAMSWEQEFVPFATPTPGHVIGCSVYFLDYDEGKFPGEMRWGRGLHWHTMRPALFNSIWLTE